MAKKTSAPTSSRSEITELLHEQFARFARHVNALKLPQGMSPERLSTLSAIDRHGPISLTALADKEMVRPASMSRMVKVLVEAGLVNSDQDQSDGRGVLISTTPKGRRAHQRAQEKRLNRVVEALDSLNSEQLGAIQALASALERLTRDG
jgi:DNA-binding MarR family transcriptional regulator